MNPSQMFGAPSFNNSQPIIWVNGYEEAKKFQIPRKSNAVLFDSSLEGRFYIKITDDIGMYNIRFFDYKEVYPNNTTIQNNPMDNPQSNTNNYITYDQLTNILTTFKNNIVEEIKEVKNEQLVSTTSTTAPNYNVIKTTTNK